jgi:hypothetical protein
MGPDGLTPGSPASPNGAPARKGGEVEEAIRELMNEIQEALGPTGHDVADRIIGTILKIGNSHHDRARQARRSAATDKAPRRSAHDDAERLGLLEYYLRGLGLSPRDVKDAVALARKAVEEEAS